MEQTLRRISVRLETSGTVAELLENTALYKGSHIFTGLRAYVPITPNRAEGLSFSCTVHRTTTDAFANRKQLGKKHEMHYVGTAAINAYDYLVFELPMSRFFTDTVGDLELVFTYSEMTPPTYEGDTLVTPPRLVSRLVGSLVNLKVREGEGGDIEEEIDVQLDEFWTGQITANTGEIQSLRSEIDELLTAPQLFEDGGEPDVDIIDGHLVFFNLKGDKGDRGDDGTNAIIAWGVNAPSPVSSIEWKYNKN